MPYAILLNEIKEFDLQKAAGILAKAQNIVYADATFRFRNATGVLITNMLREEAEMITNELNGAGIGCFFMDMSEFYNPPAPYTTHGAHLSDDSFGIIDVYGRTQPFSWPNIVLISCGRIAEKKVKRSASETSSHSIGLGVLPISPISRGIRNLKSRLDQKSSEKIEKTSWWYLDLFSKQPQEKHIRIEGNGFNYDCLRDNKQPGSNENFKILLTQICGYATVAYSNRGVQNLLAAESKETSYRSRKHFDDENFWLLQLTYLNLKNNQQGA